MNPRDTPSLESVWEDRDERVYPSLFGPSSRGVFVLDAELFSSTFGQDEIDPRWLHYGVLEFAPTPGRQSWLYASSGLSNPWDQEPTEYSSDEYSGFGSELVIETPSQADWAVNALRNLLAYNILLAHGRFGEARSIEYGARVPLGGPINGDRASEIRFVIASQPTHYLHSFGLASGQVELMHLAGITESELHYARQHGIAQLIAVLAAAGAYPVTDPVRRSAV